MKIDNEKNIAKKLIQYNFGVLILYLYKVLPNECLIAELIFKYHNLCNIYILKNRLAKSGLLPAQNKLNDLLYQSETGSGLIEKCPIPTISS